MQIRRPFISIITPTLNSARYIKKTIDSVNNQSYRNYEHIFIDGGSSDDTLLIIKKLSGNSRLISESDQGISDAFNKGIQLASGELIGIINSDDYYSENIFRDVVDAYLTSDRKSILHGDMCLLDTDKRHYLKPRPFPRFTFYIDMPVYHPTVFVPQKIYDDIGCFDLNYQFAMDYDFLLRAWLRGYRFKKIDKNISYFRLGGSANANALKCHREVLDSQIKNNLNPAICITIYILKVAINRIRCVLRG